MKNRLAILLTTGTFDKNVNCMLKTVKIKSIKEVFVALVFLANAAFSFSISASTVLAVNFEDMVLHSEFIFEGQVLSQETRRSPSNRAPVTYFTFQVLDVLKGMPPEGGQITLGFAGGTLDGITMEVQDFLMPKTHEKGVYFVESSRVQLVNPLYGWQQGHYLVIKDSVTGVEKVMPRTGESTDLIGAPTVNDFKRAIHDQLGTSP